MSSHLEFNCGDVAIKTDDIVQIVRDAGKAIMDVYHTDTTAWDVQAKGDNSPLTKADLAANQVICDALSRLYPTIPIVSEENKLKPYEERKHYEHFFCVDPLDGTKEFIKRNGQFTVNVGLCKRDTPVLGVVGVPAAEAPRTYYGVKGQGAFVEDDATCQPQRIECQSFSESDPGLTLVMSASHNSPETEDFIKRYKDPKATSLGSSLKLLLVAEGKAHVYPRMAPTCEWDTCASHAIVSAAGGEVLQHRGGKECDHLEALVYNKPEPLNPFFVVYGRRISTEVSLQAAKVAGSVSRPVSQSWKVSPVAASFGVAVAAVVLMVALRGRVMY